MNALTILKERGVLKSSTDEGELNTFLQSGSRRFYIGFDPTGNSLHIGHLVQVMAGMAYGAVTIIAIIGGNTARWRSERQRQNTDHVRRRNHSRYRMFSRTTLKDRPRHHGCECTRNCFLNNVEWLGKLNYIEFLRNWSTLLRQPDAIGRER